MSAGNQLLNSWIVLLAPVPLILILTGSNMKGIAGKLSANTPRVL